MDSSSISPYEQLFYSISSYSIGALELFIHSVVLLVVLCNFICLTSTQILHPNLRFILQVQSGCVWLFELTRLILIVQKFINNNMFFPGSVILQGILYGALLIRNYCCHLLVFERILATLYYRRYEKSKWSKWNLVWLPLYIIFCTFNGYQKTSGGQWSSTSINFISSLVGTTICLMEFIIIIYIGVYNKKKYEKIFPNLQMYNLSEKFQIAENIRTSRQLGIAFICHFMNNLMGSIVEAFIFYNLISRPQLLSLFFATTSLIQSILSGVIEFTIIMLHPSLKKKMLIVLKNFYQKNRMAKISDPALFIRVNQSQKLSSSISINVLGNPLITKMDTEAYLKIIQADW